MSHPKRPRSDAPPATASSSDADAPDALPARLASRIPWVPLALSAAVIASAGFAVRPVRDAATLGPIVEAALVRPLGYLALAPLSAILDTLTLMSARQHIALFVGVWVLFAAWRIWLHRRGGLTWRRHLAAAGLTLLAILLLDGAALALPRPMAYLASQDPNIMRVDFHSHTNGSHDARSGFSVERNRAWHRAGGYDVAFITDHRTVAPAERAIARNTVSGLEQPMLLQSIEATWNGEHVSIPDVQRTYTGLLTENLGDVDSSAVALASLIATREPVVIWHHPRRIDRLTPAQGPSTGGIRAIEISNGAPNNMDRLRANRPAILALAEQHNLTLVSGSDNHGWGYTAPNWTLMRPANWRGVRTDQLSLGIQRLIRDGGIQATKVAERVVADPANPIALGLGVLTIPARMLTTLSNDERLIWLVWIWGLYGIARYVARRRRAA